eukprot:COSAG02_NODE_9143_length_2313_cov_2.777778_4_plen_33_part_01
MHHRFGVLFEGISVWIRELRWLGTHRRLDEWLV